MKAHDGISENAPQPLYVTLILDETRLNAIVQTRGDHGLQSVREVAQATSQLRPGSRSPCSTRKGQKSIIAACQSPRSPS